MYDTSLADLSLPDRIDALISHTRRFGPVFPCYGVALLNGAWACECGQPTCRHRVSKHPRISAWPARATKDATQIAKWAAKWPAANWAIDCTEINVVDLDRKVGKPDGVITLQCWEDTMNVQTPDGVRVLTGTGVQIYFLPTLGLKTTANPDGLGIDVRSAGGYVMAPGSRHANGTVYQIDLDEGLEACPAWLVERLFPATQETSSGLDNQNPDTSLFTGGREGEGGFEVRPAARLNAWESSRIDQFRVRNPKFEATWEMDRGCRYPFKCGRNSGSEYEGALAFYFRRDGWDAQQIMDGISTWRRKHDLAPRHHSRYRSTIGKAMHLVQVNPMETVEPKGMYKHGETKARVLAAIQAGPRKPKEIVAELGLNPASVWKTLGRLVKDGLVLHVGHQYLAAPLPEVEVADEVEIATPADAEVNMAELEAEYQKYVASLEAEPESVEEEILPPPDAPAPRVQATEPSWLDVTGAELDAMDAIPAGKPRHFIAAQLKREAKEKKLARGYASRFAPTAADIEMRRFLGMNLPPYDPSDPF